MVYKIIKILAPSSGKIGNTLNADWTIHITGLKDYFPYFPKYLFSHVNDYFLHLWINLSIMIVDLFQIILCLNLMKLLQSSYHFCHVTVRDQRL